MKKLYIIVIIVCLVLSLATLATLSVLKRKKSEAPQVATENQEPKTENVLEIYENKKYGISFPNALKAVITENNFSSGPLKGSIALQENNRAGDVLLVMDFYVSNPTNEFVYKRAVDYETEKYLFKKLDMPGQTESRQVYTRKIKDVYIAIWPLKIAQPEFDQFMKSLSIEE
jgi:hypothetical protein